MTKKQAYSYIVLRYVHDVVSGESLNVGVVMHAPGAGFLKFQRRKTISRLKHVFPDLDRRNFMAAMESVDRGLKDLAKHMTKDALFDVHTNAGSYARKVVPSDDSALQWSPPGTGLTDDLKLAFERLYERYVAQYDVKLGKRRSDDEVWRPVSDKLMERGIRVPFEPRTLEGDQDRIEFKRAWKNGRWHAYQPISLDWELYSSLPRVHRRLRSIHANIITGIHTNASNPNSTMNNSHTPSPNITSAPPSPRFPA